MATSSQLAPALDAAWYDQNNLTTHHSEDLIRQGLLFSDDMFIQYRQRVQAMAKGLHLTPALTIKDRKALGEHVVEFIRVNSAEFTLDRVPAEWVKRATKHLFLKSIPRPNNSSARAAARVPTRAPLSVLRHTVRDIHICVLDCRPGGQPESDQITPELAFHFIYPDLGLRPLENIVGVNLDFERWWREMIVGRSRMDPAKDELIFFSWQDEKIYRIGKGERINFDLAISEALYGRQAHLAFLIRASDAPVGTGEDRLRASKFEPSLQSGGHLPTSQPTNTPQSNRIVRVLEHTVPTYEYEVAPRIASSPTISEHDDPVVDKADRPPSSISPHISQAVIDSQPPESNRPQTSDNVLRPAEPPRTPSPQNALVSSANSNPSPAEDLAAARDERLPPDDPRSSTHQPDSPQTPLPSTRQGNLSIVEDFAPTKEQRFPLDDSRSSNNRPNPLRTPLPNVTRPGQNTSTRGLTTVAQHNIWSELAESNARTPSHRNPHRPLSQPERGLIDIADSDDESVRSARRGRPRRQRPRSSTVSSEERNEPQGLVKRAKLQHQSTSDASTSRASITSGEEIDEVSSEEEIDHVPDDEAEDNTAMDPEQDMESLAALEQLTSKIRFMHETEQITFWPLAITLLKQDSSKRSHADHITIAGMLGKLRPFQALGVVFSLARFVDVGGVFYCDDMGLGKTRAALATIVVFLHMLVAKSHHEAHPELHLAPRDLENNTCPSAARFPVQCHCVPDSLTATLTSEAPRGPVLIVAPSVPVLDNFYKEIRNCIDPGYSYRFPKPVRIECFVHHAAYRKMVFPVSRRPDLLTAAASAIIILTTRDSLSRRVFKYFRDQLHIARPRFSIVIVDEFHMAFAPGTALVRSFLELRGPSQPRYLMLSGTPFEATLDPISSWLRCFELVTMEHDDDLRHCTSAKMLQLGRDWKTIVSSSRDSDKLRGLIKTTVGGLKQAFSHLMIRRSDTSRWLDKEPMTIPIPNEHRDILVEHPASDALKRLEAHNQALHQQALKAWERLPVASRGPKPSLSMRASENHLLRVAASLPHVAALSHKYRFTTKEMGERNWFKTDFKDSPYRGEELRTAVKGSAKFRKLEHLLQYAMTQRRAHDNLPVKVVIFAAVPATAVFVHTYLDEIALREHIFIHAETKAEDRTRFIDQFQQQPTPLILVSGCRLIGQGIQLTRASIYIQIDVSHTKAEVEQARKRINRMGQLEPKTRSYCFIDIKSPAEQGCLERQGKRSSMTQSILLDRGEATGSRSAR